MVLHETRLADRSPASGTEQQEISRGFLFLRDSFSEEGYDPCLELYQAAASWPLRFSELPAAFCELSAGMRKSEAVALCHPIMPVGDGFGGRVVRINSRQL